MTVRFLSALQSNYSASTDNDLAIKESVSTMVTLDSTFFFITADTSRSTLLEGDVTLTRNALLVTKPNYRVVRVETYNSDNKYDYPYHTFCQDDALSIQQSTPVCLHQNQWYNVKLHKRREPTLGTPAPEIGNFDIRHSNPVKDLEDGL